MTVVAPRVARTSDAATTHDRIESLLARMTLEEKVGQMTQLAIEAVAAERSQQRDGRIVLDPCRLREAIVERHVGSLLNVLYAALPADGWHALVREVQDVATRETRLGIPVAYGIDFVHGANYTRGGTVFPHNVGLAATFDPTLVRHAAEVTAQEAIASGLPWNFAPVLDVGRQPLWPRFYETFGEDPSVAARLGAAAVTGMQRTGRVAATLKHFVGYGAPRSGRDRTPSALTERELREHHLPPFQAAIEAGARSVMVCSGEVDGEPLHASHRWLTTVLRGELGFAGVVVTDWEDIAFLHTRHRVAPTMKDAVRIAVVAGIDVSMSPSSYDFADHLGALVREGAIEESRVDESVRRVLALKASLGLFDAPYPDESRRERIGAPSARAIALQAARDSITLLANDGLLPLPRTARVLLTGPAAHSHTALGGGWTDTWQGNDATHAPGEWCTVLDALRTRCDVRYVAGATFTETLDVDAAVTAARECDVAIVTLGEDAYAEWMGDIDDLTLPDAQLELAASVAATGIPTVLLLLEGRPRIIRPIADAARAIVLAYWPGREGAEAIADVLFGEVNPSGRLPFTYPKWPNALLTYDHRFTETLDVGRVRGPGGFDPEFPFGHGLSYTTFVYTDLRLDRIAIEAGDTLGVEVTVTNVGHRAGDESLLLFTRQHYATLTPAVRRLRAFDKATLAAGESRTVRFTLNAMDLAYVGRDGSRVLEAGDYDVMVGQLTARLTVR